MPEGTGFLFSPLCGNVMENKDRGGEVILGGRGGEDIKSKTITCSPIPYKYGNLKLPSSWVNFYCNFACFYYQKLP